MNRLDYKEYPKLSGIYMIKNTQSNKVYIGSSININNRIKRHYYELKKGVHSNKHLLKSFIKYGEDYFEVHVLEKYEKIIHDDLLKVEIDYINKFDSYNNGYNQMIDVSSHILKINKNKSHIGKNINRTSRKIICIDRITGEYKYDFNSISDAARFFNTSSSNISRVCKGKLRYIKGYVFCYKEDYDESKDYRVSHHMKGVKFSDEHRSKIKKSIQKCKGRRIYKYDLNLNLVDEYNSRSEAERENNLKREKLRYIVDRKTSFGGYFYKYSKINI